MEHLDQLRSLGQRLADANGALLAWDRIEAQKRLPRARREPIERPALSRRALKLQLVFLLADMSRLEQEICAAPRMAN
ncbi:MAG TPA: hypothetical protein VF157_13445 [Chloroflexota bacterium]